jgi:capsular polysaccharide biosynthesis protein
VDVQLASRLAEERRLRAQISLVQSQVAATPGLEADLIAISRDYETLKKAYEVLLAKQEDSKLAAALEQRQIGEVFKVIDPARLPESPASPNRLLIDLLGAVAGLAIGFGLVALLEYRDKGLRSEDDVLAVLKLRVLAAIPVIETRRDERRAKWRRAIEIAGAAVAAAVLAVAVLFAWTAGDFARLLSVR